MGSTTKGGTVLYVFIRLLNCLGPLTAILKTFCTLYLAHTQCENTARFLNLETMISLKVIGDNALTEGICAAHAYITAAFTDTRKWKPKKVDKSKKKVL